MSNFSHFNYIKISGLAEELQSILGEDVNVMQKMTHAVDRRYFVSNIKRI